MKKIVTGSVVSFAMWAVASCLQPACAEVNLGKGSASLLGGDLTDPEDDVVDSANYGAGNSEEYMRPANGNWVTMKSSPNTKDKPLQMHAYQDWQNCPPCSIFLNHPESRKWYLGFLDGGNGGPTEAAPYYCAVELTNEVALTHFTITTSPDMPDRDPKKWAIQGSMTGKDGEWTDIYVCDPTNRSDAVFKEDGRTTTYLFTSFTTATMAKWCGAEDARKITAKLAEVKSTAKLVAGKSTAKLVAGKPTAKLVAGKPTAKPGDGNVTKADFPVQPKAYKWLRFVCYSCFNPNSLTYADFNHPPGFALGQVELFGGAVKPGASMVLPPKIVPPPRKTLMPVPRASDRNKPKAKTTK